MWKYLRKLLNALASGNTSYFKAIAFSFCPLIFKCLNKRLQIFKILSSIKAAYPVRTYFIFQLLNSTMNSRSLFKKSLKRMKSFFFFTYLRVSLKLWHRRQTLTAAAFISNRKLNILLFLMCVSHWMFFFPYDTPLFLISPLNASTRHRLCPKWYTDVNTPRRSWEPWLLSVTSTGRRSATVVRGATSGSRRWTLFHFPRFSWWDESHSANNVFGFAVSLPQAWRERTDANCLTDLHSVFMCPATVLWKVLRLKGNMPTRLMSRFQNSFVELTEARWSGRRIDTFCLLVVFKAEAHMRSGDARVK